MLKEEKLGLITNEECNDIDNADTTREIAEKVNLCLILLLSLF
jgi:hypothetical protein